MSVNNLNLDSLINITTFFKETGIDGSEFYPLLYTNRIEGVYKIANRWLIDRKAINIHYHQNGYKFKLWIKLGGRDNAVNVKEELNRRKEIKLNSR